MNFHLSEPLNFSRKVENIFTKKKHTEMYGPKSGKEFLDRTRISKSSKYRISLGRFWRTDLWVQLIFFPREPREFDLKYFWNTFWETISQKLWFWWIASSWNCWIKLILVLFNKSIYFIFHPASIMLNSKFEIFQIPETEVATQTGLI